MTPPSVVAPNHRRAQPLRPPTQIPVSNISPTHAQPPPTSSSATEAPKSHHHRSDNNGETPPATTTIAIVVPAQLHCCRRCHSTIDTYTVALLPCCLSSSATAGDPHRRDRSQVVYQTTRISPPSLYIYLFILLRFVLLICNGDLGLCFCF